MAKSTVFLTENDLLMIEQIVLDRDKDSAFNFVKDVVKKQIDRENVSRMKREKI